MKGKTVAVDFDGVLHSYTSGWTGYKPEDGPEPGAVEFVESLIRQGFTVVVMSARADGALGREAIHVWLEENGFPLVRVTNVKVPAVAYVDDRAVHYNPGSGDWDGVHEEIAYQTGRTQ